MNLDELRSVQSRERQMDDLQALEDNFYAKVGRYISELESEREDLAEEVDDPFSSTEIRQLTDEIETAKDVTKSIYERRMGKIVKNASLDAAGYKTEREGLTTEEEQLLKDLVARIEQNKSNVLDILSGESPSDKENNEENVDTQSDSNATTQHTTDTEHYTSDEYSEPSEFPDPPSPQEEQDKSESVDRTESESVSAADMMQSDQDQTNETTADPVEASTDGGKEHLTAEADQLSRTTVQILDDIGSIVGIDECEYDLAVNDVVSLPEKNAEPLIDGEVAEPID